MQRSAVLLNAAVVLGVAAIVLGYVAGEKSKDFLSSESFDGQHHCVYRRNPGLGCGVAGALLLLMGIGAFLATAASGDGPVAGRVRAVVDKRFQAAALAAALMATFLFLYGAAMKRGLSRDGCTELRSDIFFAASMMSAIATVFGIIAGQRTDEPAPGVQPYPPPPVANPAPPQDEHDGYGDMQPAGTA